MDGVQCHAAERRLLERESHRELAVARAVHADDDGPVRLLGSAHDEYGAGRVGSQLHRDRAHQQTGEPAEAAVAEHDERGAARLSEQDRRGGAVNDGADDVDVRVDQTCVVDRGRDDTFGVVA